MLNILIIMKLTENFVFLIIQLSWNFVWLLSKSSI